MSRGFIALAAFCVFALSPAEALAQAGSEVESTLTVISERNDFVGSAYTGESHTDVLHEGNSTLFAQTERDAVEIHAGPGDLGFFYRLEFAAPSGQKLVPGHYGRAERYLFADGRPGMDIGADSRGCNTLRGSFDVLDLAYGPNGDPSRLWITFEQSCSDGTLGNSLYGEIRINQPSLGNAVVAPRALIFPKTQPGTTRPAAAPIEVLNTGLASATITSPTLSGSDSNHFSVSSKCPALLPPGERCSLTSDFRPRGAGPKTASLRLGVGGQSVDTRLEGVGTPGRTEFTFDEYHRGAPDLTPARRVTPSDVSQISGFGKRSHAGIMFEDADRFFHLFEVSAPPHDSLRPGRFTATRHGFNFGSAGIGVPYQHCNKTRGSFDLRSIHFNRHEELESLDLSYDTWCEEAATEAARGVVRYQVPGADPHPPDRVNDLEIARSGTEATIQWANPADSDFRRVIVRYVQGPDPPRNPLGGRLAYAGNGSASTLAGLDPDKPLSVAVFSEDSTGNVSTAVTSRLRPPRPETTSYMTMMSERDEFVGAGRYRVFDETNSTIDVISAGENALSLRVTGGSRAEEYRVYMQAPEKLTEGLYTRPAATRDVSDARGGTFEISGDGRACGREVERFQVKDIEFTPEGGLARLWLNYEQRCPETGEPYTALFGEIAINKPMRDPNLLVTPSSIWWPETVPRTQRTPIPISVTNLGGEGVDLNAPAIGGFNSGEFAQVQESCSTKPLEADESCEVTTAFRPTAAGPKSAWLDLSTTDGRSQRVALDGHGIAGRSEWTVDPYGLQSGGRSFRYTSDNAVIALLESSEIETTIRLDPGDDDDYFFAKFHAGDRPLKEGHYPDAVYYGEPPPPPGMFVDDGEGVCDGLSGFFTIRKLRRLDNGEIDEIDLTFDQRCPAGHGLRGRIAYRARDGDTAPPAPVSAIRVEREGGRAIVSWDNPADAERASTIVRYHLGPEPPVHPTEGTAVLTSRDAESQVLEGIDPDDDLTVSAFTVDAAGNWSDPATSVPLPPTVARVEPDGPANENRPRVIGTAQPGTQVEIFDSPSCAGSPIGTGSATEFAQTGLAANVPNDSTTRLFARAVTGGVSSPCSSSSVEFVEDSTPPLRIAFASDPGPRNDNVALVRGDAETGAEVSLYEDSSCATSPVATTEADKFEEGIRITLEDNTSRVLWGKQVDAAKNSSACSLDSVTIQEDSTPPPAPYDLSTDPAGPANFNRPHVLGRAPAASTVSIYPTADCLGSAAASGSPVELSGGTLRLNVADDSVTTFTARSRDEAGNLSGCSVAGSYLEDSTPPDTVIDSGPSRRTKKGRSRVRFHSSEPAGTFECRLDARPFATCDSPWELRLKPGRHSVTIAAIDRAGNRDESPAVRRFRVR